MYIVLVEHEPNTKTRYLFDCTDLKGVVRLDDTVICETMRGPAAGTAVTNPIRVEAEDEALASLFSQCGAYLPVKRILGVQRSQELSEADRERIAKEWLREKLETGLPF